MALQLGVNTCLNRGELLLMEGEKYVDRLCWEKARSHSQVITHQFLTLMERNQAPMGELTLIQCGKRARQFHGPTGGSEFCQNPGLFPEYSHPRDQSIGPSGGPPPSPRTLPLFL